MIGNWWASEAEIFEAVKAVMLSQGAAAPKPEVKGLVWPNVEGWPGRDLVWLAHVAVRPDGDCGCGFLGKAMMRGYVNVWEDCDGGIRLGGKFPSRFVVRCAPAWVVEGKLKVAMGEG